MEQVQLCLAMLAYAGSTGEAAKGGPALRRCVSTWLTRTPPTRELELLWGPASVRVWWQPSAPAVVAFVVGAPQAQECFLVLRGGAPASLWDASLESFGCLEQEPWSWAGDADGLAPAICAGLHRKLGALRELAPEEGCLGAGRTLTEFLRERLVDASRDRRFSLRVTGHGAGGSLAVAAALWLRDTQDGAWARDPAWDAERRAKVHCTAFAAPCFGNGDFISYLEDRLPEAEFIQNHLDHVPALWDPQTMLELPKLYAPHVREPAMIRVLVEAISTEIERQGVEYEQPPAHVLEGRLQTSLQPTFTAQAEYQHLHAYVELLGLSEVLDVDEIFERPSGSDDGPIAQ
nr:lipase family protein [Pseudenhygromyxa sp. WMMC2535]